MCGIFGYVGPREAVDMCLSGLKKLEYRGYDSAGLAGIRGGKLIVCKESGRVAVLEKKARQLDLKMNFAIAHTRWATHGKPCELNAHPHTDQSGSLALVHNGIIENHEALRQKLRAQGVTFLSETDTEVVAGLISYLYQGNLLKAVQEATSMLEGSFAMAIIHASHPDQIVAVAHESPLAIGVGNGEVFLSSDTHAFLAHTREVVYLGNGEVALVSPGEIQVFNATQQQVTKKSETLQVQAAEEGKGAFEHYTLKEIFEQPQTIRNALLSRFVEEDGNAVLEGLNLGIEELKDIRRVLILACGSSWHAGCAAAYLFEDKARLPTQVEISSEFRYKNPIVPEGTLVVAISQSGETADTLAAVRELKAKGAKVISLCNVYGSTLARESHGCLFLKAGQEVGVCSTKAFTNQLIVLSLLGLLLARTHPMSKAEGQAFVQALKALPQQVEQVLSQHEAIEAVARKYASFENFFFLGRNYMYPASLEGALKLKEISYLHASGYPAGEMKHGPIALINEKCPTVALCANKLTLEKIKSNLCEVKARGGPILGIVEKGVEGFEKLCDDVIRVPQTLDELAIIPTTIVTQLLAYHIARARGREIDHPRNLAKSVTVE